MTNYLYELGYIRTDRGQFIDRGNYGFDSRHQGFGKGGAKWDGVTEDTAAHQAAINAAASYGLTVVRLGFGTSITGQLTVPSYTKIKGLGIGVSILKAKASLDTDVIVNADGSNTGIEFEDFEVDGNYANQAATSTGIAWNFVSNSKMTRIRVTNCRGGGVKVAGGADNTLTNVEASDNGVTVAGYGIYFYNTSRNKAIGCTANNNCIGFVVEASASGTSSYNQLTGCSAKANRADFSQSGAGFHEEASAGGTALGNQFVGIVSQTNSGPGILSSAGTDTLISGATVVNNVKAGGSFASVVNIKIDGGQWVGNGAGAAAGYKAGMTFDDTGLTPASTGYVNGAVISGSSESIKTFAASTIIVDGGDVTGCDTPTLNFNLGTSGDRAFNVRGHAGITRVSVLASATYNLRGCKGPVYYLTCAGDVTITATAADFKDGERITLLVYNNTVGVITVTLGSQFQGTFTAPATTKKKTLGCIWDGGLPQFAPLGAISADF